MVESLESSISWLLYELLVVAGDWPKKIGFRVFLMSFLESVWSRKSFFGFFLLVFFFFVSSLLNIPSICVCVCVCVYNYLFIGKNNFIFFPSIAWFPSNLNFFWSFIFFLFHFWSLYPFIIFLFFVFWFFFKRQHQCWFK